MDELRQAWELQLAELRRPNCSACGKYKIADVDDRGRLFYTSLCGCVPPLTWRELRVRMNARRSTSV